MGIKMAGMIHRVRKTKFKRGRMTKCRRVPHADVIFDDKIEIFRMLTPFLFYINQK